MKVIYLVLCLLPVAACSSGRHYDFQILKLDSTNQGILGDFEAQGSQLIIVYKGIIRINKDEAKVVFNIDVKIFY